jgi:hypothetical protein
MFVAELKRSAKFMNLPPQNSIFKVEETFECRKITIPKPKRKLGDIGGIAFLCFWLCGWAVGEIFVTRAVWSAIQDSKFDGGFFFICAWLGGWTVGGAFAIKAVVNLVKGEPPEIFVISASEIIHQKKDKKVYRKNNVSKIDLETSGGAHYLYFDVGADRVFIGEHIREPEREWLFSVIKEWKEA